MKKTESSENKLFRSVSVFVIAVVAVAIGLMMAGAAVAHTEEAEIAEGKALVEEGVSCNELNDEQLEAIGEYLMGLMHPGEAHELMHQQMGIEEGTPYHEKFHINLAQSMYCGEAPMAGMMGMMQMMGSMPWWNDASSKYGLQSTMPMQQGMMGKFSYGSGYSNSVSVLYIVLLLGLIGLVYFWLLKMWKGAKSQSHTAARGKHGR